MNVVSHEAVGEHAHSGRVQFFPGSDVGKKESVGRREEDSVAIRPALSDILRQSGSYCAGIFEAYS